MGFPTPEDSLESAYRNPRPEVQRFFKQYHGDSYKIYNLCEEREYDIHEHFAMVAR